MSRVKQAPRRWVKNAEGGAAVEFGMVLPILLLLMLGGMDLGHMFYMQHVITNASREGARYGANYTGNATPPTDIENYIKTTLNYNSYNFNNLSVSRSFNAGTQIITVTVQANKNWWILGKALGLSNPKQLTATTAMLWQGP